MGFSLEGMFRNLHNIIENDDLDDQEKQKRLIHETKWWYAYAIQCGQIKEQ
tara:strand:- start:207 stop:359 length:153 start_codon:yes stop_codon:yes gene_type:complete